MTIKNSSISSKSFLIDKGEIFFHYGIFFLPTLLPLALILFSISLTISLTIRKINFANDRWNQFLFLLSGIIVFNSIKAILFNPLMNSVDNFLIVTFNTLKWITLFLSFFGFQQYLKTRLQRVKFIKFFLIGSVPIILSCFLQYWFKIYGPFEFLNGLIVWYNKPLISETDGVSGLFSNQNYTGFWLSIIWPFCVYSIRENKNSLIKNCLLILLGISIIYLVFMTTSRASILGIIISIPIIFSLKFTIGIILLILLVFLFGNLSIFDLNINKILMPQPLKILLEKLMSLNLFDIQNSNRITIWTNTLNFIYSKPIFGFGAGLFPIIYLTLNEEYKAQHSHNIILQLAFDYGIFLSIGLSFFIFFLLYKSWLKIFIKTKYYSISKNSVEVFWFASSFVAVFSQLYDVSYFEGKISLLIWILLAGLKSINDESNQKIPLL